MKAKIEKLIKDYENQIVEYDKHLSIIKESEHELRKQPKDVNTEWKKDDLYKDRQVINAQKQRTIQFISDLKYL